MKDKRDKKRIDGMQEMNDRGKDGRIKGRKQGIKRDKEGNDGYKDKDRRD